MQQKTDVVHRRRPDEAKSAVGQTRPGAEQTALKQIYIAAASVDVEKTRPVQAVQAALEQIRPEAGQFCCTSAEHYTHFVTVQAI